MKRVLPILALSVLLAACGKPEGPNVANSQGAGPNANKMETNQVQGNADKTDPAAEDPNGQGPEKIEGTIDNVSLTEAFLRHYPQGQITSISYDKEDGGKETYKVEGIDVDKEVEILVDKANGQIQKKVGETKTDPLKPLDIAGVKEFSEAVDTGKSALSSTELESFDLEKEGGRDVYKLEFKDSGKEITLDAKTLEKIQ